MPVVREPKIDRCVIPAHLLNLGDELGVSIARFRDRVTSSIGARRLLSKLTAAAFLTFSRRASATVIAAEELVAAGLASLTTHPNNEFKLALKK